MLFRAVLLASLLVGVLAGAPTVDQNFSLFPQNGGTFTVTGSGFTRFNPQTQFNFILRNSMFQFSSDRTINGVLPGGDALWPGCVPRTLTVNAAGTVATCTMTYIPDYVLEEPGAGVTSIEVDVSNSNGVLAGGPVTVAIVENVNEVIFASTTNGVPAKMYGFTITGRGFPAWDSLAGYDTSFAGNAYYVGGYYQAGAGGGLYGPLYFNPNNDGPHQFDYWVTLSDGTTDRSIDILKYLYFHSEHRQFLPHRATSFISGAGTVDSAIDLTAATDYIGFDADAESDGCECTYDRDRIDCQLCKQAIDEDGLSFARGRGLTARIGVRTLLDAAGTRASTDAIGPTQIAVVNDNPSVVTIVANSQVIQYNEGLLTVTGSGFARFPSVQSNIVAWVDDTGASNEGPMSVGPISVDSPFRCDTVTVNSAGTRLTCRLRTLPMNIGAATADVPLPVVVIVGDSYGFGVDPTLGAVPVQVALVDVRSQDDFQVSNSIVDASGLPVQMDARTLVIRSSDSLFPTPDVQFLDPDNVLRSSSQTDAKGVSLLVVLSGVQTGIETPCSFSDPNWADPFDYLPVAATTVTPLSSERSCIIQSASADEIVLRLPPITTPIGTSIEVVQLSALFRDSSGAFTRIPLVSPLASAGYYYGTGGVVVGHVAPGAGVGGDPHFFGFLGEKYEFAGVPGQAYNILSDENVQLNAVIGRWHIGKSETIVRSLALKTAHHRLFIDAGGNKVGAPEFSILFDGEPLNETRSVHLANEGEVQWRRLGPEDKTRLPLWEKHNGIAMVEIALHDYLLQVMVIEEGRGPEGEWIKQPARFLDFMCQMTDADRRPHGLFGQSAHLPPGKRSVDEWELQGAAEDYKVSHAFADDFTFNKFVH